MSDRGPVVVITKHENGRTSAAVGLTGSMRRFLHVLRRREDGLPSDYPLKPNEKKLLAMIDAGLIELRLTGRGRTAIQNGNGNHSGDESDSAESDHGEQEDDEEEG